jgi:hypothetical protein
MMEARVLDGVALEPACGVCPREVEPMLDHAHVGVVLHDLVDHCRVVRVVWRGEAEDIESIARELLLGV